MQLTYRDKCIHLTEINAFNHRSSRCLPELEVYANELRRCCRCLCSCFYFLELMAFLTVVESTAATVPAVVITPWAPATCWCWQVQPQVVLLLYFQELWVKKCKSGENGVPSDEALKAESWISNPACKKLEKKTVHSDEATSAES